MRAIRTLANPNRTRTCLSVLPGTVGAMGELDPASKAFLDANGAALVRQLLAERGIQVRQVRHAPTVLVWREQRLDYVFEAEAEDGAQFLFHFEVQVTPRAEVPERTHEYNARLRRRKRKRGPAPRVISVLIYLRPDGKRGPARSQLVDPEDEVSDLTRLGFDFHAIRAWDLDSGVLVREASPLLPLLPYARGASPALIRRALARLARIPDETARADLMAALATFAGDVFPGPDWFGMIPEEIRMKNTFLRRVRDEGKTLGRVETLYDMLHVRLGAARARRWKRRLEAASDERLREVGQLIATVPADDELVTGLKRLLGAPARTAPARRPRRST